ncbi:hypothetical protein C0993_009672 [Termitomyces sp. T159_Od127]|nr:hypothetical protein C0993_009672 [Termitomyces sp. T159_Od127]
MSRYPLWNQQPRRSVRRLSPTAIRDTGPLRQFEKVEEREPNLAPSKMEPALSPETPASASYTAMPTEMDVDAAEPQTSVKVGPDGDGRIERSSLMSSLDDDDR